MLTLGVLADTHVPERAAHLHPEIIPFFKKAEVRAILHAGDVSRKSVLEELAAVAPVHAVRGNRDIIGQGGLPMWQILQFEDVRVGLTHGHGGWGRYILDKFSYLLFGPQRFSFFMQRARQTIPEEVDVVVFGHNHSPMNKVEDGQLIFNPGSAWRQFPPAAPPSVGLLRINGDKVEGEIVFLSHYFK
jgi:hypothetical protein